MNEGGSGGVMVIGYPGVRTEKKGEREKDVASLYAFNLLLVDWDLETIYSFIADRPNQSEVVDADPVSPPTIIGMS